MKKLALILLVAIVATAQVPAKKSVNKTADKPAVQECDPVKDAEAQQIGEFSSNGSPWVYEYRRCNSQGKWISTKPTAAELDKWDKANKEWEKEQERIRKHREKLWFALRSRVLSDEEMAEVEKIDWYLVPTGGRDNWLDMRLEFNAALIAQYKIKLEAEKAKNCGMKTRSPE